VPLPEFAAPSWQEKQCLPDSFISFPNHCSALTASKLMASIEKMAEELCLFTPAIEAFEANLTPWQIERCAESSVTVLKKQILRLQKDQEIEKSMVYLGRLVYFINAFSEFEKGCRLLRYASPKISRYIWGPVIIIIQVSLSESQNEVQYADHAWR
jgi:hypothetical protein